LLEEANRLARHMRALGVCPGDRVVVQAPKSTAMIALYLATLQLGAIFVPLNSAYKPAGHHYHRELLPTLDIIHQATRSVAGRERDSIAILALPSFVSGWLVPRLDAFRSHHPDVAIEFSTLRKRRLGYTDIIIEPRFDAEAYVGLTRLFRWVSSPVCRPALIERHDIRTARDVTRATLLDLDSPVAAWSSWLEAANISEGGQLRWMKFDSYLPMMSALRQGLGFGLLPLFYQVGETELVAPFDIVTRLPGGVFVRDPAGFERPIVRRFRAWMMDEIADTTRAMRPADM
jgi:DNA-binding transcriptional LysR family regulator